jgi:S1-C subfamily serine protease
MREIIKKVRSGVVHINFFRDSKKLGSGSGFILKGRLVTNNHVIVAPENTDVVLEFDNGDFTAKTELKYKYPDFLKRLEAGSGESSYDYAVFNIPEINEMGRHSFEFGEPQKCQVGDEALFLGYHFDSANLVCHKVMLSSFFKKDIVSMIQLDGSVNQGNSGGPLFDPGTGKVLGMVSRKVSGLSAQFDKLFQVFEKNIEVLNNAKSAIRFKGVDPVEALIVAQNQMKGLCHEISRSANVGIGYAVSIEHLSEDVVFADNRLF